MKVNYSRLSYLSCYDARVLLSQIIEILDYKESDCIQLSKIKMILDNNDLIEG